MAHLVFHRDQIAPAVEKWESLQLKIKRALLKRNSEVHPDLLGDQLPEVHAAHLVQSEGYYRWEQPLSKIYWHEHLDWLEEAMQIVAEVGPSLICGVKKNYREKEILKLIKHHEYKNPIFIKTYGQKTHDRYVNIVTNPYPISLCAGIIGFQRMFEEKNLSFEIICDDYEECKGFSTLTVYEELRRHGLISSVVAPEFLLSHKEQLIQMADVAAYGLGQYLWLLDKIEREPEFVPNEKVVRIIRDFERHLLPLDEMDDTWRPHVGKDINALILPVHVELIAHVLGTSNKLAIFLMNFRDQKVRNLARYQNESEPIFRLAPSVETVPLWKSRVKRN